MALNLDHSIDKLISSIGSMNVSPALAIVGVDIGSGHAAVYALANSTTNLVSSAFTLANSTTNLVTGAYTEANNAMNYSQSAFAQANSAAGGGLSKTTDYMSGTLTVNNLTSNVAINTNSIVANTRISINGVDVGTGLSSVYTLANSGATSITSLTNLMTGAYNLANSDANLVGGAYGLANTAVQRAADQITGTLTVNNLTSNVAINTNSIVANTRISINGIDIGTGLSSAYASVNSTTNLVTSAFNEANSTTNLVTGAYNAANSAGNLVTGSYSLANTHERGLNLTTNNVVILGQSANSRGIQSRLVYANGSFANIGDAQWSMSLLRNQTTSSAATYNLSSTGANSTTSVYGSINQLALGNNCVYGFTAMIVARDVTNMFCKVWDVKGAIKNVVGPTGTTPVSNTNIIGNPNINIISADNGTNNWTVALATDLANNALLFTATGSANTTNWVCKVDTVSVA